MPSQRFEPMATLMMRALEMMLCPINYSAFIMAIPGLFIFIFVFSLQLIVNKCPL